MKKYLPFLVALSLVGALGCAWRPFSVPILAEAYQPSNFYRATGQLPDSIRRVAVLPVVAEGRGLTAERGRDDLAPVLYAELGKLKAFELVIVSPEELRSLTTVRELSADEKLPADFFERLHEATGCDAVLFARLTQYRPYGPITVGWNLKLVDAGKQQVLWAADEVYDAGDPAVSTAARRYCAKSLQLSAPLGDPSSILLSPRRFGQYAANATLASLPTR